MRFRHGPPVRTVRASRALARLRPPCGAASAHQACNLAPGGGPGTVRGGRRTGGTVRARHGPPVRTVRASRARARLRAPCGAASAHQACNLAPGGGLRTVLARSPQPAGVAVGREARCGAATDLPSAPCARRGPVGRCALRAALQARTRRATSHRAADPAPFVVAVGWEARYGPATGLPSAPCVRRGPVQGCALRAALQACTRRATSHQAADPALCVVAVGREARCGPATGPPSAPCVRRGPVQGCALRAALQARTKRATSHRAADPAPCRRGRVSPRASPTPTAAARRALRRRRAVRRRAP